jgi:chromosome segregation ATPase
LHESEEKSLRECNRLQEMCDSANNQYQNAQTVIENLRAEINDINSRFSNREAVLEQEINEWKSKLADMEQQKLDLNLQLDNLNGELLAARNHEQELETLVSQVCYNVLTF